VDLCCSGSPKAAESGRPTPLFYRGHVLCQTARGGGHAADFVAALPGDCYSSFALIVILALSTLETGQPFSAASAYFWNHHDIWRHRGSRQNRR